MHDLRSTACSADSCEWPSQSLWSPGGGEPLEVLLLSPWSAGGQQVVENFGLPVSLLGRATARTGSSRVTKEGICTWTSLVSSFVSSYDCTPSLDQKEDTENPVAVCLADHWALSIESPCCCNCKQIDRGTPVFARSACKPSAMQTRIFVPSAIFQFLLLRFVLDGQLHVFFIHNDLNGSLGIPVEGLPIWNML